MKTLIFIILFITTTSVFVVRSYRTPPIVEMVVLQDITDSMQVLPQADEIFQLYGLKHEIWGGAEFRFVDLSDVSLAPSSEIKLAPANRWLSNELEREKEIKQFNNDLASIIESVRKRPVGKNYSSMYLPLVRELNRLSRSSSQKRILLVYSDLMENTPDISFYNAKTLSLLQSSPDSLKQFFEKQMPIPSLTGIKVYFIYEPADVAQDREFKAASEFYKKLLEDKGAQVTITANL